MAQNHYVKRAWVLESPPIEGYQPNDALTSSDLKSVNERFAHAYRESVSDAARLGQYCDALRLHGFAVSAFLFMASVLGLRVSRAGESTEHANPSS